MNGSISSQTLSEVLCTHRLRVCICFQTFIFTKMFYGLPYRKHEVRLWRQDVSLLAFPPTLEPSRKPMSLDITQSILSTTTTLGSYFWLSCSGGRASSVLQAQIWDSLFISHPLLTQCFTSCVHPLLFVFPMSADSSPPVPEILRLPDHLYWPQWLLCLLNSKPSCGSKRCFLHYMLVNLLFLFVCLLLLPFLSTPHIFQWLDT